MKDFERYLGIANYDILMVKSPNELINYVANLLCDYDELLQENRQLKKQLKKLKDNYKEELEENSKLSELWCDSRAAIRVLENQQKEFVNWLKSMSKMYVEEYRDVDVAEHYNCVLAKYKEIIGGENE